MSKKQLKPCPFCGSKDVSIKSVLPPGGGGWGGPPWYEVTCNSCHTDIDFHSLSEINTLLKWNSRAEPPNDPLTLDELRDMDGEPVWVENIKNPNESMWALVQKWAPTNLIMRGTNQRGYLVDCYSIERDHRIYRRRPEGVQA